jgi:hypothetical protein
VDMWTVRSHIIPGQGALPLSQHTQLTIFIGGSGPRGIEPLTYSVLQARVS